MNGQQLLAGETARKELLLEYTRRMNAGDVDAVLELFTEDIVFEDPVGSGPKKGLEALREHIATAVSNGVTETPGRPVAAQDGLHVSGPVSVRMKYLPAGAVLARYGVIRPPAKPMDSFLLLDVVLTIRCDNAGRIDELRGTWGFTDVSIEEGQP